MDRVKLEAWFNAKRYSAYTDGGLRPRGDGLIQASVEVKKEHSEVGHPRHHQTGDIPSSYNDYKEITPPSTIASKFWADPTQFGNN